nr:SpvB/TcaC N-terminal domain-containing protein [Pseudenhygromyxa sp. WMMC2535]
MPGTFVVDDRGAARYSVPLALPPAARGFAPALSLEYDSQRGDGGLGVGWALSGASAIDRCPRTLADDGYFRGVQLDDEDALCLDGQRLRLVEGEHLQPGARYRPKRDDLSSVRAIAFTEGSKQSCHGGLGFEVRRSDGTIDLYGCRRDAVALHPRGLASWSLAERRDCFGNVYALNYTNETELLEDGEADVERWLTSLEYGGHTTLHAFTRHVRLEWEDRPDPAAGWRLGAPQRQTKRLAALSTFAEGELVHRYELDYDTPSITGRSLLHAVRQCDAQGVCRPDTTFAWTAGSLDFDTVPQQTNFAIEYAWPYLASIWSDTPNTLAPRVLAQTILDANGDGRSDFLLAVGQSNTPAPEGRGWELWTSQPKADTAVAPCSTRDDDLAQCLGLGHYLVHEDPISGLLAGPSYDDLAPATPPLFAADIDGDGRDDAVGLGDSINDFGGAPPAGSAFYLALARPEGGIEQVEFDPGVSPIWQFTAHDQTGDGLGDLLFCAGDPLPNALDEPELGTGTWHFTPNLPTEGFISEQVVDTGEPCSVYDKLLALDHDGDGLASLLVIPTWDAQLGAWIPSSKWSNYHALRLNPGDWSLSLEDTGLPPDLAQRWRPSLTAHYNDAYLDEDFPRSQQGFGLDKILDIDGDGLSDILRYELVSGDTAEDLGTLMQTIVVFDPPWAEQGGIRLWRNTGAGFVDGGWLLLSPEPGRGGFRRFLAAGVLDYDADGRLDLLSPVSDPNDDTWNWSIFNLDSEGVLHEHPEVFHSPVQEFASNVHSVGAFDLDGDGLHDPGVFLGSSWQLRTHAGEVPDKLKAITNGLGARIEVDYRASADIDAPEGYADAELDSVSCLYPARCDRSPRLLVEAHRVDSGISDAPQTFTHRYGTARRDREAQRSLGFRFHETTEWRDELPVYRRLVRFDPSYDDDLHAFPFAGMPSLVAEDRRDPETGRHVVRVTSHSLKVHSTGPSSYLPYAAQTLASRYELDACEEDFCALTELDEDHRITREVHTVFDLDDFGNPTHWTRTTSTGSETFTYRTQTSYQNDAETWLLGLPTKTVLSFEQPGIPIRTRESIAAYDPETGALLHHETQPNDAELRLVTGSAYDAHGNEVTRAAIDTGGILRTDTTKFDDHGVFPISTTNALGHQTQLRWHPGLGVLTETRDPNNLRLVADYDGLGHVTPCATSPATTPAATTSPSATPPSKTKTPTPPSSSSAKPQRATATEASPSTASAASSTSEPSSPTASNASPTAATTKPATTSPNLSPPSSALPQIATSVFSTTTTTASSATSSQTSAKSAGTTPAAKSSTTTSAARPPACATTAPCASSRASAPSAPPTKSACASTTKASSSSPKSAPTASLPIPASTSPPAKPRPPSSPSPTTTSAASPTATTPAKARAATPTTATASSRPSSTPTTSSPPSPTTASAASSPATTPTARPPGPGTPPSSAPSPTPKAPAATKTSTTTTPTAASAPSPRSSPANPSRCASPTTSTTASPRSTTPKTTSASRFGSATSTPKAATSSKSAKAATTPRYGPSSPSPKPAGSAQNASATAPRPPAATTPCAASSSRSRPTPCSAETSRICATTGTPTARYCAAKTCSALNPKSSATTTCTARSRPPPPSPAASTSATSPTTPSATSPSPAIAAPTTTTPTDA